VIDPLAWLKNTAHAWSGTGSPGIDLSNARAASMTSGEMASLGLKGSSLSQASHILRLSPRHRFGNASID
jgi:hypothetical protein